MKTKFGLELGIRAEMEPTIKAAEIARKSGIGCYLVPETHPKLSGVDAFDALKRIAGRGDKITIGTGVVSIYSRYKDQMNRRIREVTEAHDGKLWLGLGSSTPYLARMWGREMKISLSNLEQYTMYAKYNNPRIKVLWGVSRDKAISRAASRILPPQSKRDLNPDGVIFHMKTVDEIKRSIDTVEENLSKSKRKSSNFETVAIRLVYMTRDEDEWRESASLTLANYIANNPAYTPSLERAGFGDVIKNIKFAYESTRLPEAKLKAARGYVTDEMLYALTTHGSARECADELHEITKRCGVKTLVLGIEAGRKDYYMPDFEKNLVELLKNLV